MAKSLNNMTLDDLQKEQVKLNDQKAALKARLREVAALLDRRAVEQQVADMSEAERQALAQVLKAEGVGTGEAFGEL